MDSDVSGKDSRSFTRSLIQKSISQKSHREAPVLIPLYTRQPISLLPRREVSDEISNASSRGQHKFSPSRPLQLSHFRLPRLH